MSPLRGEGQKEADGSIRNYPVYCRLPLYKVKLIDEIGKIKGLSRTDIISEAVDLWISKYPEYQENSINISTEN